MHKQVPPELFFVIKAEEILALNYLPPRFPRPCQIEWINRATDRQLSPSTLEQLMRTYHREDPSPSVAELKHVAGVRAIFETPTNRNAFASLFAEARKLEQVERGNLVTAIFASMTEANTAAERLWKAGVPESALSFLWRANAFLQGEVTAPKGHSFKTVASRVTGGGVVGAAVGTAVLLLPGVGQVAVAGGVLLSAYSAVATASGMIGATAAAIGTMLSDLDVDDFCHNHLEEQLQRGRIFLSVDLRAAATETGELASLLDNCGGKVVHGVSPRAAH